MNNLIEFSPNHNLPLQLTEKFLYM